MSSAPHFIGFLTKLSTEQDAKRFAEAIFTPPELAAFEERLKIVRLLLEGKSHREVARLTGASLTTIARGSREIKYGNGIFQELFSPR
jgi:Trp operon repressor